MRRHILKRVMALFVAGLAGAPASAAAEQREPSTSIPDNDRAGFNVSATIETGVWFAFRTLRGGRPSNVISGYAAIRGAGVNRVVIDAQNHLFFGYRIEGQPTPDGRIRVEVKALPDDFPDDEESSPRCDGCPPFTRLSAALVRYPEPTVVEDGALFGFELLRKLTTGETIVDQVRVHRRETAPKWGPRLPTDGRFAFELKLEKWPGKPGMLRGEFQLNDVTSGKNVSGGKLSMPRDASPGSTLTFPGVTADGRALRTDIRISGSAMEGTLTYEFELREADVLVQSQRVTVPLPSP